LLGDELFVYEGSGDARVCVTKTENSPIVGLSAA
jgi:hypothetical protein